MNEFIKVALRADSSNFEKGFAGASASVQVFKKTVGAARGVVEGMDNALKSIGQRSAAVGASLAATMYGASKAAMTLDTSMRNVNSISQQSEAQFRKTTQSVIDMSTKIPVSAEDIANGLYDVASSGFEGADGLKVMAAASLAATAGMTDSATAAKGITAVLNAYGLSADSAADVSDILFKTVDVGVLTFADLVQQLGDFLPIGQAIGISFDQQAAAMAALTKNGFPDAQAATALTGIMRGFIKPSTEMTAAIHAQGYESGDAMVKALGLKGALDALNESVGGDITSMGQLFQDTEGLRGALSLTSNGGKVFAQSLDVIAKKSNRAGAAQDAYSQQSKALSSEIKLLHNNMTAIAIGIGQVYLPVMEKVVKSGTLLLSLYTGLPGPIKTGVAVMIALSMAAAALGATLLVGKVRQELFSIAGRKMAQSSNRLTAQLGSAVARSRHFSGAIARSTAVLASSKKVVDMAAASHSRYGRMVDTTRRPVGALSRTLARLAGDSTRATNSTGIMSRTIAKVRGAAGTSSAALERFSLAESNAAGKASRLSRALGVTVTSVGKFTGAMERIRPHIGAFVSASFIALTALTNWKSGAEDARNAVSSMNDEVFAKHDMGTLKGMSDAYDEMYQNIEAANSASQKNGGILGTLKGAMQLMDPTGLTGDSVQKSHEEVIQMAKDMAKLKAQYKGAQETLNAWALATGLSNEEGEKLATTLGIDLTKGLSNVERGYVAAYQAGAITREEFIAVMGASEGQAGALIEAGTAAKEHTTNLSALGEQLKAIRSPIKDATGVVIELTKAQQDLMSSMSEIGSASTAWSAALDAKKAAQQKDVDDELDALQTQSDARIQAAQDRVEGLKSGSKAHQDAQNQLEALRKREKDILDQRKKDLEQTVEDQKMSLQEYTDALINQNKKLSDWKQNLVAVTTQVTAVTGQSGEDVARYLAGLGTDGMDLINQLLAAGPEGIKGLAATIRENIALTGDESAVALDAGLTTAAQIAEKGAANTRQAILNELGMLPDDAVGIMDTFGKTIQDELNKIIVGLGGEPIDITTHNKGETDKAKADKKKDVSGINAKTAPYNPAVSGASKTGSDKPIPLFTPTGSIGGYVSPDGTITGWGTSGDGKWHKDYVDPRKKSKTGKFIGGYVSEGENYRTAEPGTGGEWALPVKGDKARQRDLWMRAGRSMGISGNLQGFSGGATSNTTITHRVEKHAPVTFSGPMVMTDPSKAQEYAERKQRLARLRGGN